jgi:TraU protein
MRRVMVLAWLLGSVPSSQAGIAVFGFNFPLDQFPGTTFVVRGVTQQGSAVTQWERPLDPVPAAQCASAPDPARTPGMLCGQLCLDPNDYTLSLSARLGGQRSPETPLIDVDARSTTPCVTTTPPPPPPSPIPIPIPIPPPGGPPPSHWPSNLLTMINWGCVSWKITGPCLCTPFTPCLSVEYWQPGWLVETVKKPGTSTIPLLGDVLNAVLSAASFLPFGGGGAANATGSGQTNLHFSEAHVYSFPDLGGPCTGCVPKLDSLVIHYASELDPRWRIATSLPSPLDLLPVFGVIGVWQRMYPRVGFAIHGSPPVASGIAAVRALDIAFNPAGLPPNIEVPPRPILSPSGGTSTCMQLASPRPTFCFPAGTPPPLWDNAVVSPFGNYSWIVWRRRSCCVDPSRTTCGITMPGVGGQGANFCLLPSTP